MERLDLALGAPHGVVLERSSEGEEEEKDRALLPLADGRAAEGNSEHEEMDIQAALLQQLPDLEHGEPGTGEVGHQEKGNRPCGRAESATEGEDAADRGTGQLALPLIEMLIVVVDLHLTRDQLGKGNGAPVPESWGGGAGDTRQGGGMGVLGDLDLGSDGRIRGAIALGAIPLAGEQPALVSHLDMLQALKHAFDPLVQGRVLGAAHGGDRHRLVGGTHGDRLDMRLRPQDLGGTRNQAAAGGGLGGLGRVGFHHVAWGASPLHGSLTRCRFGGKGPGVRGQRLENDEGQRS